MQRGFIFFRQFIALFILFSFSSSIVFGQTRRTVTKKPKATVAEKEKETCANCWSGVIRYEKVLNEEINENEPVFGTTNPKSERIVKNHSRAFEYTGKVVVDGSSGRPVADTKVSYNYGETQTDSVTEFTRCRSNENDRLITVAGGSKFSLVLLAPPNVSATLTDEKGEVVGTNLAGTPEAGIPFRTITVKKPFSDGKWKLKLESREQTESEIVIAAFIDYNSKKFSEK